MRIPHGLRAALAAGSTPAPSGYQIARSLRFNSADSAYLSRTPASAGNRKTWTWSGWVKRSAFGQKYLFGSASNSSNYAGLFFNSSDQLTFVHIPNANTINLVSSAVFRDASAWYHIICSVDTTQASSTNGVRVYVNGTLVSVSGTYTQNADTLINSTSAHGIGALGATFIGHDGYLADVHFIDGQALTPSSFGEFDANGIWQPKAYTGAYSAILGIPSGNITTSGTAWSSTREWEDFFAQTLSDAVYAASGATYTVTFSPAISVATELKLTKYSGQGVPTADWVFNGSVTKTVGDFSGQVLTLTSAQLGGTLSSIRLQSVSGTDCSTVIELEIDGKRVRYDTIKGNGFKLDFADNSNNTATTLGKDTSGNGNNWTPNNLSVTAGAGNDSLVDSPTNYGTDTGAGGEVRGNYCTINPIDLLGTNVTISNGNLSFNSTATDHRRGRGTIAVSSGKWYAEGTLTVFGNPNPWIGIISTLESDPNQSVGVDNSYGYGASASKRNNNVTSSYGATYGANDVISIALDLDAGTIVFYKNGVSQGTAYTGISGTYAVGISINMNGGTWVMNFGQRPFAYTAPSGFKALCTQNLPAPSVTKPSTVMDALLWTGNSASPRTVSGLAFEPDLVWLKSRSISGCSHVLNDQVRGANKRLSTDNTLAESSNDLYGYLSAFTASGFTVTSGSSGPDLVNLNNSTYVAWCWDAGSSTVTNTAGSITSSVRANTSAGFSIVKFTSPASGAFTVGHGLGTAPYFIIQKIYSTANSWPVYHQSLGSGSNLYLNLTNAAGSTSDWNNTSPTSTVYSLGSGAAGGYSFIAYCFAPIAGFSAFGSYTGNASTDGPFVYLGFQPAFVMLKRTDSTSNWTMVDAKREGYNVDNDPLYANLSDAEGTTDLVDLTSNGFKLRTTDTSVNASSGTYIYAAFAEQPFKTSRAR
ncbi:MAG: DUF7483 domain-containing protein [Candidatus Nanopelagicaceae bacterium]